MSKQGSFSVPSTPTHERGRVPPGAIAVNMKWRDSQLVKSLSGKVRIVYDNQLEVVDFHPANDTAVIYISEQDMVAGTSHKKRIVKLRKVASMKGVVLAEKTDMSQQYCQSLQRFVVLELGLVLLFVTSPTEAADLLIEMWWIRNRMGQVLEESKPFSNPFRIKRKIQPIDGSVLSATKLIPRLGSVKAKALLIKFGSIKELSKASTQDIAEVVGQSTAMHIYEFLNK
ncbi:Fanconi anemia core complex-associated protein 24-like isoform X1 [Anneissia japonica]|uniref:Fanconi anemia core complex-associated protein 24-like isoform X1 n=1 Tax=Anneissia japonica TaxID=1529436 RepID=UPI0014255FF1|nr:Fanconi anemia core complex-associated protein 24-like isoform X1 [Anneissia japonica]